MELADKILAILTTILVCIGGGYMAFFFGEAYRKKKEVQNRYTKRNLGYWELRVIKKSFTASAVGGFKAKYTLTMWLERINDAEFELAQMLESNSQDLLVNSYNNELFMPYIRETGYAFVIQLGVSGSNRMQYAAHTNLYQCHEEASGLRHGFSMDVVDGINALPRFKRNGCSIILKFLEEDNLDSKLVNENYAMLTEEQKRAMELTEAFAIIESRIAIFAAKRQHDFLGDKAQRFEAQHYSVETETSGCALKIKWEFKQCLPTGYELLGFRKAGGFSSTQYDENNNGLLVVHSHISSEVTEFLPDNEAQFYTFFLRGKERDGKTWMRDSLRFQVRVAGKEALATIEALIERLEAKSDGKRNERISKSLEELNLVMEFHDEIDKMERSFVDRIKAKGLSKEEEDEKIEFIRDIVRLQREKYQP